MSRRVFLTLVPGNQPPNHKNAAEFKTNLVLQQLNKKFHLRRDENNFYAVSNLIKDVVTKQNLELFKFNGDST